MATKPVSKSRRRKVCATPEDTRKAPAPPLPRGRRFIEQTQPGEHLDLRLTPAPSHNAMRQYDAPRRNKKKVRNVPKFKPGDTIKHTLRYYEKKLTTALLKNAPHSLLTLTERAHGSDLINHEVKSQLESLDPSVPNSLMCRYLLLHVQKVIDSHDKVMHWLELLSTVEVPSNLLSLVRQHYDSLVGMTKEGGDGKWGIFREFEVPALTEILARHSSKWEVIAISLGLPDNKIKNIAAKNVSKPVEVALNEVLLSWVRGESEHAKPATMKCLQKALRSNTVGLGALANEVGLVNSQMVKHSVCDIPEEFGIDDHTKHVDVTEGNYTLLEVQISGNHKATYLWTHSEFGTPFNIKRKISSNCILCIIGSDISLEGYYKCEVTCTEGDKTPLYTEPIPVTVHTPIDQYKSFLVDRYTCCPEMPSEWPPASINSYINLALIKQEHIHKAGKYGRCTIRGDMDDIYKDKESITYDKALGSLSSGACLLIEGRPGSGKTTLVHKFSQDWARNEITMTHVRLLFLIHLRGFCSDPNIGLCDLIGCYFRCSARVEVIEKYADKHQGLGLCFVLDGLDEYMPQRKDAFIYQLIRKQVLPKSIVIVASRPAAAADFRKKATRQIEVLGFLRDQIYDYIENYHFSCPSKSHTGLIKYLDEHPNVLHMCYLPIHTCMVCFLYDNLESNLPQTETSIYAEFTRCTMLRMLYRDDNNSDMCIESLNDLHEPQNQLYVSICKLAFEMTKSSKQVMTQTEVKDFFNLQPTDKDCLGLITVDKMAMMCGLQNLYTFLHLTFQEFLAAFYITSLEEVKQIELIEQFRSATQMKQVWKFYCGLVPFNCTNSTVIKLISQSCHGTPFKVQCSFESQQSCTCDSVADKNSLMFKDHFFTSSDLTAMAYVISNAQHQCVRKIVFDKCTIGMEGVEILAKKACGKLSFVTTLCYHGYDCVTEQLSVVNRLMHSLPCLEILDVSNTNLGQAEVDALTGSLSHSNLQIMKVGSPTSPDLQLQLAKRFSLGCSNLINVCFSGIDCAHLSESLPFPFYFYCNVPHINMCFNKLRPIEFHVLIDDLMCSHNNCAELYLTGCGIDDNTVSILSKFLKQDNLNILDLSCNRIGDKGAVSLAESIKYCLKLTRLNLSLNRISDVGAMAVASATKCLVYLCGNYITNTNDILQHVSGNNVYVDFHTLTFSGCGIGDSGVESLLHLIEESNVIDSKAELSTKTVQCYSSLHVLDISSNNISYHGVIGLSCCLKHFPYLKELNISSNSIGAQGVVAIASCLSAHLHTLNISNNGISSSGAKAIADAPNYCVNVVELDISLNLMSDNDAIALAEVLKHYTKLCKLNISYNNIAIKGANAIADALNQCIHLEELRVSHNNFGEIGACFIARSFRHYARCLHKLDISYNNINSKGCKAVAEALQHCVNIKELNVACNSIDDADVIALADVLKNCDLHRLDISHNKIGNIGVDAIADVFNHCFLKELIISHNSFKENGACSLARSLCHAQCLRKFDISYTDIGSVGTKAIAYALDHCTHLEELIICQNNIKEFGACSIARYLCQYAQSLRKLDISYNSIGSNGANAIADALNHCTHLEELIVNHNNLKEDGASSISISFCNYAQCLRKLDISYNNIGTNGANAIADALNQCSHLEELIVSHNNLGEGGAFSIAKSFAKCIIKIDISHNIIGSEGCKAIAEALQNCVHLREISMSHNLIDGTGAKALAEALIHCSKLCKLDMSYNYIGNFGVKAIADALKQSTHLEELALDSNIITEDGACSLASTFYHTQNLHKLCISNNRIGSKGCQTIAKIIQHSVNIKALDLSSNYLTDNDAIFLAKALQHCSNLQELNIRDNNIASDSCHTVSVLLKDLTLKL